jgi:hypothetical protein
MLREAAIHIPNYPITLAALSVAAMRVGELNAAAEAAAALEALGDAGQALTILQDPAHRAMILGGMAAVRQASPVASQPCA